MKVCTSPRCRGTFCASIRYYDDSKSTVGAIKSETGAIHAAALIHEGGSRENNPPEDMQIKRGDSLVLVVNTEAGEKEMKKGKTRVPIKWTTEYSVGVEEFDEEHRHIFKLINNLEDAISVGQGEEVLAAVFDELLAYTESHFHHEEEMLREINFPGYGTHKAEHEKLSTKVADLNKDRDYVFPDNVSEFLRDWIGNHILGTDKEYGSYVEKRKQV